MKYTPTKQQENVLNTLKNSKGNPVLVQAVAGAGKTSTALLSIATIKPKKALYTAFNKAIVVESKSKFPSNVECRTLHALALSYIKPKLPIHDFSYHDIREDLSYPDKKLIIDAMDEFYRSDSVDMHEYLDEYLTHSPKLIDITIKYIEGMLDDKVNPTFNFLLKYFHILLVNEEVNPGYDMVILDEIQDSTAVALEIFKELKAPIKLGLGDEFQSIYQFMNLVNGFKVLKKTTVLPLTKSFRCSTEIAEQIQEFGIKYLDKQFEFIGTDTPKEDGLTAYLTLTNAGIIERINELHSEGKSYTLTRDIKEIFACPLALVTAASGKEVYHRKYKFLESEYKNYALSGTKGFYDYLKKNVRDDEIESAINLIMKFNKQSINIFNVLKSAKAVKSNPAITVATAYSFKGRETSDVYIEDDLNKAVLDIISSGGPGTDEDYTTMKVAYVALSRARTRLHNCKFL